MANVIWLGWYSTTLTMDASTLASMKAAASCEKRYELQISLNVRLPNALGAYIFICCASKAQSVYFIHINYSSSYTSYALRHFIFRVFAIIATHT